MNRDELAAALASDLPTERMSAAQQLASQAEPMLAAAILDAISKETVPRIRRLLSDAHSLATHDPKTPEASRPAKSSVDDETTRLLSDLGGLIRHETEPAIGWVRRAAKMEVADFETSRTNLAIERLRSRIAGLSMLAQAQRPPEWREASLHELLTACIPPDFAPGLLQVETPGEDDAIETDRHLLTLILSNALQNAVDASEVLESGQIFVQIGMNETEFWLSISNRFAGESFDFDHVSASGASNKHGHRGLGVAAMRSASSRLGYALSLQASGGVATFALRGKRFRR